MEEHLILGVDERDLQVEKSRWLTDNPGTQVVEIIIRKEPPGILARIGGKYVPRVSMLLRFTIMHSEALLSPTSPSGKNHDSNCADGNGNQSARQDLLSSESPFDVEHMTQHGRS